MGRLFGTDGVRGVAGRDLTAQLAMDLAVAGAGVLSGTGPSATGPSPTGPSATGALADGPPRGRRPVAVVGRDPRTSGEFLEAAVVAGLASSGVDVLRLGVIPTPGVAFLTAALDADFGVMLSASHNPARDNGIKFFARGGLKLPDAAEDELERRLAPVPSTIGLTGTTLPELGFGRVTDASGERERYLDHLLSTLPGPGGAAPLTGLRVVVDCAHGAAYEIAPRMLRRAGAEVIAIGAEPDGENINAGCGSTNLSALRAAVAAHGADAGIAHDGDADRCLAVDASGEVIDGDQILAVLAFALKEAGRLADNTVVVTVMSNLGLRLAMRDAGIALVETPVGDRHLVAAMREGRFVLGGEQSGHIILLDHATTGDGLLTALHLLATAAGRGQPLGELAKVMTRYPQVLVSVPGVDRSLVSTSSELTDAVRAAEAELGESGRVLVRPSGTERVVRVMVEAVDSGQAHRLAGALADTVRRLPLASGAN
ncbi:MAG TPA: phosphoglucosamine mutase [Streptosporangiaceae bacterium]|nr:phosphoglucosamine mutase [Streptosporangiaceae bacterium]